MRVLQLIRNNLHLSKRDFFNVDVLYSFDLLVILSSGVSIRKLEVLFNLNVKYKEEPNWKKLALNCPLFLLSAITKKLKIVQFQEANFALIYCKKVAKETFF